MTAISVSFVSAEWDAALAGDWDDLVERDPQATYFQARDFLQPIAHGPRGAGCRLLLARQGGRLVGALGLRLRSKWDERRGMFRTDISMMGSVHWADYNGPVVDPQVAGEVLASMGVFLAAHPWARLRLKNLSMTQDRQQAFLAPFGKERFGLRDEQRVINQGSTDNLKALAVALPPIFDEYLAGLSRNTRQKLRRFLRRVDAGEMQVSYGSTRAEIDALAELWARQRHEKTNVSQKATAYAHILDCAREAERLSLPMLYRDDQLLAALGSFLDRERAAIRFFVSARDPEIRDFPVGLVLHAVAIRDAIGFNYRVYDLLRGDEDYKKQLGATARDLRYIVLRRRSLDGRSMRFSPESAPELIKTMPVLVAEGRSERAAAVAQQCSEWLGK